MENKNHILYRIVRLLRRTYHTVNNNRQKFKDVDFRAFSTLEYPGVILEEVKDPKRLEYVRKMRLAKKGYIDGDLKKRLARSREKKRLVRSDHQITTIGNLRVLENNSPVYSIRLGFQPNTRIFFMAARTLDNIPLWKKYDDLKLRQAVSTLHPSENRTLQFEHSISIETLELHGSDNDLICTFYNDAVKLAFQSNPCFKETILSPNEVVLSDPNKFIGKQFNLSNSEDGFGIMTLTEATERYLVFQSFLKTAPKAESLYFSTKEFKERFLDGKIERIAFLKQGLQLGIRKGSLYISRNKETNGTKALSWQTYERLIQSSELSARERLYLSKEVIEKKNFVVEKDAIVLENKGRKAYLKKHYRTGQWRFAENKGNQDNLNFRPIDSKVLRYLRNQYDWNGNLDISSGQAKTTTVQQPLQIQ